MSRDGSSGREQPPAVRAPRVLAAAALLATLGIGAGAAPADSLVPTGRPAPELTLTTLDGGKPVRLADHKARAVVLVFGELYNRNSVAACRDVATVLARPAMADVQADAYLIITQKAPAEELLAEARNKGIDFPILHDPYRRSFADYRVVVLPSVVVVDGNGITILPCAGYPLDFQDLLADTLLLTAGRLTAQEYARRRAATSQPAAPEEHVRAMRLAVLGEQLAKRGSEELAVANFKEALALYPDCVPARLGLGTSLLGRRELAEAETQFRHVLRTAPDSIAAALGLIHIQTVRGGDELKLAEQRLRELLRKWPNDPRVLYLAGLVAEKSGDANAALGYYRRAAERQLYGQERKWELE